MTFYDRICNAFQGKAELDITVHKQYLQKRKRVETARVSGLRNDFEKNKQPLSFRPTGAFNISNTNLDA